MTTKSFNQYNQVDHFVYPAPHKIGGESGDHGITLSSECPPNCSNSCRKCFNGGPKEFNINAVTKERPDTWRIVCEAFNIENNVVQAIEDNSADAKVRCIDVIHYMYHHCHGVTLDFIEDGVRRIDPHLASVINSVKLVTKKS